MQNLASMKFEAKLLDLIRFLVIIFSIYNNQDDKYDKK